MNPYDKARELARAITESDEFKKFQAAKLGLEADDSAKSMIEDFQKKQFELQKKQMMGEELKDEDSQKIQELYGILSLNKVAGEFLQAEFGYARMMQDVMKILQDVLE